LNCALLGWIRRKKYERKINDLSSEISNYQEEFSGLKNQEITIRELEGKIGEKDEEVS